MRDYYNVNCIGCEEIQVKTSTSLSELSKKYADRFKYPILAAKVNNELRELFRAITEDCDVELIDITNVHGFRIYQRTAVFMMVCAVKEILGKDTRVIIEHSINKNYYFEIQHVEKVVTEELLEKIEKRMHELVEQNIPIQRHSIPVDEAVKICNEMGLSDKVGNFEFRKTANVNLYRLNWFYDYFYGPMAPSTGCIKDFGISKQSGGFLLRFPSPKSPTTLLEKKSYKKLEQVFSETSAWAKIMKADTLNSLNKIICDGKIPDLIRINEALHEKKLAMIADTIHGSSKSVVTIAGPSSSGKTTFAQRLAIQLRVIGLRPHVISMDNYFLERDKTPKDEYGEYDFESIRALDVELLNKHFEELLEGKMVEIPTYNFMTGKREYKGNYIRLTPQDVLVIEGIHGLNDAVTNCVPKNKVFKIFISALTQLNIDDHNRISTTDARMIRRIIRDARTRNVDCAGTISMWPSVTRGEALNIFPFQNEADVMFNSSLVYEMCVLKQYAEPLLFSIKKSMPQYIEARRIIKILDSFFGVSSEVVPYNSILREFIGGSCFKV